MSKIKVLIADDIMILRKGLKAVLEMDQEIEVVALAENGKEAFEKCKVYQPDVVLMDMRMPDYDGAYGIRAMKEFCPEIRALVLTTFDDEETIQKAVESYRVPSATKEYLKTLKRHESSQKENTP